MGSLSFLIKLSKRKGCFASAHYGFWKTWISTLAQQNRNWWALQRTNIHSESPCYLKVLKTRRVCWRKSKIVSNNFLPIFSVSHYFSPGIQEILFYSWRSRPSNLCLWRKDLQRNWGEVGLHSRRNQIWHSTRILKRGGLFGSLQGNFSSDSLLFTRVTNLEDLLNAHTSDF